MSGPHRNFRRSALAAVIFTLGFACALPAGAQQPAAGSPGDLLKDAGFRAAWAKAAAPLSGERWVARLEGPAPQLRSVTLSGTAYTLAAVCKPHDCGDNNLVLLHDPSSGRVHALVHRAGRSRLLGAPPPEMAGELEKVWRQEWRQGR